MALFELTLMLLLAAVFLAALSRRISMPYPALLALAGAGAGFLPFAPRIDIDPELALTLFVAPVLLDAAYDTSLRDLRRYKLPLIMLALGAVVFTTCAVALLGWWMAGLPAAAAIALGAIVAPPDAVAASAVLGQFRIPHRVMAILQGESLLNDATALLIYRFAVGSAAGTLMLGHAAPMVLLGTVGSVIAGYVLARLFMLVMRRIHDAASNTVMQFVGTFGVWILAEQIGLSAIITIVVYAITIARRAPSRLAPRNRVSSYSVWETAVFVLNVLAFTLMGLQARTIVERLAGAQQVEAMIFAGAVLAVAIVARLGWVLTTGAITRWIARHGDDAAKAAAPSLRGGMLVGWCGMRGLVTLATAFALPADFPGRDPIVLAAFAVVLGTLILQGMTLKPLLKLLRFEPDQSVEREVSTARIAVMEAALATLEGERSEAAEAVRGQYAAQRKVAKNVEQSQGATEYDTLRLSAIAKQREVLEQLRRDGTIGDEAYHRLEEEIDWAELAASPAGRFQPLTT